MKNLFVCFRPHTLTLIVAVVVLIFTGCTPAENTSAPGSNNARTAVTTNANITPPPTALPSPSPAPACDDRDVDQQLIAAFTDPRNQNGPDGFKDIQKTINFYSKDCEIYIWGYTKNFGRFKRLVKVFGQTSRSARLIGENIDNLYIEQADYPPGTSNCVSPYKACNDICIPETDTCWSDLMLSNSVPTSGANQNAP